MLVTPRPQRRAPTPFLFAFKSAFQEAKLSSIPADIDKGGAMRRPFLRYVFFALLAILVVPFLVLGDSGLRPLRPTFTTGERTLNPGVPPGPPSGLDSELLVGELSCRTDPFGTDTRVTFVAHGTITVQAGGMGEVIGRLISSPENPCPELQDSAASAIQGLGCVTGLVGNDTQTFVCHDGRERVLQVMAVVSRGVLTGNF